MNDMFYDCNNLEYINLNNSVENPNSNVSNIFHGVPNNIVFCSSNEENLANIISEFKVRECVINDCTNNWRAKIKKYIDEKNTCIDDCKEDTEYFYEYKNKCYKECPEGTHLLYYIDYLCIIDCPENYPFEKNNECRDSCSGSDFFNKLCRISNYTIQAKEYIANIIANEIINNILDTSLFNILNEDNSDIIIKDKNEIYQITN